MTAEQRDVLRKAALFVNRDDGKCASAAGLPIGRDILRICLSHVSARAFGVVGERAADLDQIGVPCILRDAEIIVALLLRSRISALP